MTEVPLKEHLEKLLDLKYESIQKEFDKQEQALKLARRELDNRLEKMNEFRAQLDNQAKTFVTKDIYEFTKNKQENEIQGLLESRARMEGKASRISVNIATILAVTSLILGLLGLII